jgi:thiol-disulfide isomerase/thioredoxin
MRIRYFALLTMISVLSIGAVTGCSSPTSTPSTETAAKVNPCAAKVNPCAAKVNPCAAKVNPCAAKAKPSGDKAVLQSGSLAAELQGKPVVVDVYASWCPACKNVAPTLEKLKKEYAGKANFVVLDVSDKATTAKATARAKELGLDKFLAKNISQTGLIAIFDPATGKVLTEERDESEIATYKKPLDAFIAKAK